MLSGMNTLRLQRRRRVGLRAPSAFILFALTFVLPGAAQQPQPAPTPDNEYQVGAILWTQTSGEIRALYYQAFHWARMVLDQDLKHKSKQPRAVVVDVDETVLDNSPFQASLIKEQKNYSQQDWAKWTASAQAAALPGAVEFLRYAAAKGVRVFYITNRAEAERAATADNLTKQGFPGVSNETLLLRTDKSSKEPRRQQVAAQYRIVLLLGDNLNDFAEVFEQRTTAERLAAVEQNRDQFGTHFIMLPNAMYGDWENAIYNNPTPGEARGARRRNTLKGFTPQP
jgi:5'-nucleotidase (lipoprotein e(P4) family)